MLSEKVNFLKNGLEHYFSDVYGEAECVTGLRRLTGGTSHETWAFDLVAKQSSSQPRPLILRRDFGEQVLDLNLQTEYQLLKAIHGAGIPVPEALFCVVENSPIETPFLISERLNASDIRKEMAQSAQAIKTIGQKLTAIQASIHALDWPSVIGTSLLAVEGDDDGEVAIQVERWSAIARKHSFTSEPLLLFAIDWLMNNLPGDVPTCLVHGDYKANNLLITESGRVAVIDWELAHIGDPYEDLAFTMLWNTRYDLLGGMLSEQEYLKCYEDASGMVLDEQRLLYWKVFVLVKLAAIFLKGFNDNNGLGVERPTRVMLVRAMPWVNYQLGLLLSGDNGLSLS